MFIMETISKAYQTELIDRIYRAFRYKSRKVNSSQLRALRFRKIYFLKYCWFTRPDSGRYIIDGQDVSQLNDKQLSAVKTNTLVIFKTLIWLPITASTITSVIRYRGWSKPNANNRWTSIRYCRLVISRRLSSQTVSGGQQQRVAIAGNFWPTKVDRR